MGGGEQNFVEHLILSSISGKPAVIDHIREDASQIGITDYQEALLKLLDVVCQGIKVDINDTGTRVKYFPGLIMGGKHTFHCPNSRSVVYFLNLLILLLPFAKLPSEITLTGVTHNEVDISVDAFRLSTLKLLKFAGLPDSALNINKRGSLPHGGGEVCLHVDILKNVKPFDVLREGVVKSFNGVAYTNKCSPHFGIRMVDEAKALLAKLLPEVWIHHDSMTNARAGKSPGFGLTLVADYHRGNSKAADCRSPEDNLNDPETVGRECVARILAEVEAGGVTDSASQFVLLFFAAVAEEHNQSNLRFTRLTQHSAEFLRLIQQYLGVTFSFRDDRPQEDNDETSEGEGQGKAMQEFLTTDNRSETSVILSCLGRGIQNISRGTTM